MVSVFELLHRGRLARACLAHKEDRLAHVDTERTASIGLREWRDHANVSGAVCARAASMAECERLASTTRPISSCSGCGTTAGL